ncbi:MAG: hypothetical protein K8R69_07810, partial [Deltaproteobacteria bacterium]|nr:hypothetical protein [Deltaproteobacteria bacterium]
MEKAFGKSETNAQFFYDLLHGDAEGLPDEKIDGAQPEPMADAALLPKANATNKADGKIQGHEAVSLAFNRITKYYPKISEHFQALGLDLSAMLGPDGAIKADFAAKIKDQLLGKDSATPKKALSFQSAQLFVAEREQLSLRDPAYADKFKAFMDLPEGDRDAQLKKFYEDSKNVGKLVRWAFRFSEFSLLPLKDQVEVFKQNGFDEAVVKSELGSLWQGRGLPKLVAQAALLKGLELEEQAKTLEGDAAQKKSQEARMLFRAAVELDNKNPLARRRLSTYLLREGKMESASDHLAEAVKNETELRYMVEIVQGLEIGDKRLLNGHGDPWAFVADNLISVQRHGDAAAVYHEAARAATARGEHVASIAFTEKELRVDETGKPYALTFTAEQNPVAMAFYKALVAQGLPSGLLDGQDPAAQDGIDRKITPNEIFAYLDSHWKEDRVQLALKSINFPALPWENPGAKPAYVDAAFEKLSFAGKMAASHQYEVGELQKKQPLELEVIEKRLRLAAFYEPNRSERHRTLGDFYLSRKNYPKAVTAFQAADVAAGGTDVSIKTSLGHALYGKGDFKAARDMYSLGLEKNPKDPELLKFRFETNQKYTATLDKTKDAEALKTAQAELNADGGMILALGSGKEKAKLADLEKLLGQLHDGDVDKARVIAGMAGVETDAGTGISKKDAIAAVEGLAENYLSLADQSYKDPKDIEMVRGELNGLAAESFSVLSRFAAADSDPEIQRMAKVYEGYALVAQGKIDEAVALLKPLRKIPQADRILGKIEKGQLRLVNLSAVEAWEVYNKDMERAETDSAKGWASGTSVDSVAKKWTKERAIATAVKEKLSGGEADTIEGALKLVADSGDADAKERAKYYLSTESRANGTGPIGDLIAYVGVLPASASDAQRILDKAFDIEAKKGAVESSFAMYAIIQAASPEAEMKKKAQIGMDALQGKAGFGRSVEKFFAASSGSGLAVDVGLMFLAAGLGNLAKLRMLAKLENMGVNGYKAVAIANAIGIGTEATALWGANTVKAAMISDPSKVFSADHLLKSYGSTLLMIGGLKGFGKLGEGLGPRAAKSLGLVTETGASLTKGGKVLVWGIGQASGLGGMIATSHANQALGLTPKPIGGWKEGLVHDVFGYVQFAIAHKVADGVVKGKMTQVSQVQHTEIAFREAVLVARGQAETLGFKAERFEIKAGKDGKLTANGKDLEALDPAVKAAIEAGLKKGKGDKVEDQVVFLESPERKLMVGLLVQASLNRPGFAGAKLTKLLAAKDFAKANEYLKEFQLPLHFDAQGQLVAGEKGEPSPHESLGIVPSGDTQAEGDKGKAKSKKSGTEEIPFADDADVILVEDGMSSEPQTLAARKGKQPPPKKNPPAKVEVSAVKPLGATAAIPAGLRIAMAINGEGNPFEVPFNESGIALLDKNGKIISASESAKVPHAEIQMTVTDRGEVHYQVRAVGSEKLQTMDSKGKVEEVTATYRPLQEGDVLRIGGNEYSWHSPRSREALGIKAKAITQFDGRVYLEDVSAIEERTTWARTFIQGQEKTYVERESIFNDAANEFAKRVAKDPRMSRLEFREAFVEHCNQLLKTLRPLVDRAPANKRSDLAYGFLRQIIDGQISMGDAKALVKSVESGNLVVAAATIEAGKKYNYELIPAIKGVPIPKGGGMLEGLKSAFALDFAARNYQVAQIGEATLQLRLGMAVGGKPAACTVTNKGDKGVVEIYDSSTDTFKPIPPRGEAVLQDGAILRVGGKNYIWRSPEALTRESLLRLEILSERESLIGKRASVSNSFEITGGKTTHPENLEKLEQDFRDQMAEGGRDADGVQGYSEEVAHLALGGTEFAGPARLALAGKINAQEYRQAQTELGKKMVEEHREPLAEVDTFLSSLPLETTLEHRFAELKGEHGEWIANPHTRLKDPADIAPKLSRRGWSDLGPLTDVAGARVVVRSTNDVLPIVEAIEKEYKVRDQVAGDGTMEMDIIGEETTDGKELMEVTLRPDKDHPDRLTIGTSSGYRAMHVVVEVDGKPVEIQIQTEAIYQWGKIQHSLVYKNKNLPKDTLDELNVFCRDTAKYLTDLENGPDGAHRPGLPLVSKNLKPELRAEIMADLKKMDALMDRYEQLASDPGHHNTKVLMRPPSLPPSKAAPAAAEGDTKIEGPGPKVGSGRIPARRAAAQALAGSKGIPGVPGIASADAPKFFEVAKLKAPSGEIFVLPRNKAVVTIGSKEGEVDVDIGRKATNVAPIHAEIVKDADGTYHLRPIDGQDVFVFEKGGYRRLKTTPKGETYPLKIGDRIKIGSWEFTWKIDRPPPLPPPAPKDLPLPSSARLVSEAGYRRFQERGQNLGRELVRQVEASDAVLSGESENWNSSFANGVIPDRGHVPIRTSWKHLSRAEFETARDAGTLKDTPASEYSVQIFGEQRKADVEARLRKEYGSRLQKLSAPDGKTSVYLLRNERGEAQVKILIQSKEFKVYTTKQAREIYSGFVKEQLPVILEWAKEPGFRGNYAFRILEMIGVSADGKGGSRFGTRIEKELRILEGASDPVSKRRAEEEL